MSSELQTQPRWIVSFADLLSVVLSFLVLAYSMSLPANTKPKNYIKPGDGAFSVNQSMHQQNIAITHNNQDLSSNYLYQVMEKKIAADSALSPNITLRSVGDSLIMTIKVTSFLDFAPRLTQLLKVLKNDVWIYSSDIDTSKRAHEELKKSGFDKNITIMQSDIPNTQIDIVVHP